MFRLVEMSLTLRPPPPPKVKSKNRAVYYERNSNNSSSNYESPRENEEENSTWHEDPNAYKEYLDKHQFFVKSPYRPARNYMKKYRKTIKKLQHAQHIVNYRKPTALQRKKSKTLRRKLQLTRKQLLRDPHLSYRI